MTSSPQSSRVTRLAPSPTGALHLGNARTFLLNWALARQAGWRVVMRIEDLDGPRIKRGAAEAAMDILQWLGLDWDGPVLWQSSDLQPYRVAMTGLAKKKLVFPCELSRREIAQAVAAPHGDEHENLFPPSLRPPGRPETFDPAAETNWRIVVPDEPYTFEDLFAGPQAISLAATIGDFVVWTRLGQPSYQLAVVVDDARQGVTDIVRGDDLLASVPRQALIRDALGLEPVPRHIHLPLVVGTDGRRLAKRHGDTRISTYRDRGVPAEAVVGLLARWSGIGDPHDSPRLMTAAELVEQVSLDRLPPGPVTFTDEDHQWLVNSA